MGGALYLFAPSEDWKLQFQQEAQLLERVSTVPVKYQHIGSTAVTGLYAKDVIDILGLVTRFEDGHKLAPTLVAQGYTYRGEYGISGRHYFVKTEPVKVHLHIYCNSDNNALNHLWFVHFMRQNPDYVAKLNALKIALHRRYPDDKAQYQASKAEFYQQLIRLRPASFVV